ncbi:hypothetical protein [Leptolyngbya sp. FACHB-261]|uniref:hypothetical protein n=1 Tax=Leptolyngbya sp. FACHB-261 TaxID=2692806 RepID=UPI00168A3151|nr:hypothetical protein [Leptolyngbya sp. FACHB-261]MBD2103797.1 hypothetical protein [Leptolyngbya sp. FACHB-261]
MADRPIASVSFEEAIEQSQLLLSQWEQGQLSTTEAQAAVSQLLDSANGARGFFVAFLTGDSPLADQPPPEFLAALQTAPPAVAELLVKNLAMPTAMALTHQRNGDTEQQQDSERVARRTIALLKQLHPSVVVPLARAMQTSAQTGSGNYAEFLNRWRYDTEQRQAIATAMAALLPTEQPAS